MALVSPGRTGRYEYQLKFLLVGDSDVGKNEILNVLEDVEQPTTSSSIISNGRNSANAKSTSILIEGKIVKLQLWDTSGQGRFATIYRSYSRGAQGVLVVFDITNKWSFSGITRWLKEIDDQAPGIPRVLIGNRLHLEFRRAVSRQEAEQFAARHKMQYFEVSPLATFNVTESLTELSRAVLMRNGMQRLWKSSKVSTLQELCCRCIIERIPNMVHTIDRLPLPGRLQLQIRSYATSSQLTGAQTLPRRRNGNLHKRYASLVDQHFGGHKVASSHEPVVGCAAMITHHRLSMENRFCFPLNISLVSCRDVIPYTFVTVRSGSSNTLTRGRLRQAYSTLLGKPLRRLRRASGPGATTSTIPQPVVAVGGPFENSNDDFGAHSSDVEEVLNESVIPIENTVRRSRSTLTRHNSDCTVM